MGGFNPITTVFDAAKMAGTALDATKGMRNLYADGRSIATQNAILRDTIAASEKDAVEKATLERRRLDIEQEENERTRKRNLERSMATRQAAFGNQGIGTQDGSGLAVMQGLLQESDAERDYRTRLDALRRQSIEQDLSDKRRRNLLTLRNASRRQNDTFITNLDRYF